MTPVGVQYYMALSGLVGEQGDAARMKLLLSDRAQQGSFCLTFDYRMLGQNVGTLKVLLDNNSYPVWEQSQSRHQSWQTEFLTVAWKEEAPETVSHVIGLEKLLVYYLLRMLKVITCGAQSLIAFSSKILN